MSPEEEKNLAYYERNMLAMLCAYAFNDIQEWQQGTYQPDPIPRSGWYYDTDNNWDGWHRVISIDGGRYTFHIPDGFEMGNLPQIEPNWDGHSTEEKWRRVDELFGIGGTRS